MCVVFDVLSVRVCRVFDCFCVCFRLNKVFFTMMVYTMREYTFFCNELNTFLYIPMFAIFAIYSRSKTKNGRFPDAITNFPKTSFALIGTLDMMVHTCHAFILSPLFSWYACRA